MAKEAESYELREDRVGKKGMVLYLDKDVSRRLKIAGAMFEMTLHQIGEKAIEEWLNEHGFPPGNASSPDQLIKRLQSKGVSDAKEERSSGRVTSLKPVKSGR